MTELKKFSVLFTGLSGTGKTTTSWQLAYDLNYSGFPTEYVNFDSLRKKLVPEGVDAFSADPEVKKIIYGNAIDYFKGGMERENLIIDCGISVEKNRRWIKDEIPDTLIVHLYAPLYVCIWREMQRSLRGESGRGSFLYMKAYLSLANPFSKPYPQPGVTYEFEYPHCADVHIDSHKNGIVQREGIIIEGLIKNGLMPKSSYPQILTSCAASFAANYASKGG